MFHVALDELADRYRLHPRKAEEQQILSGLPRPAESPLCEASYASMMNLLPNLELLSVCGLDTMM